MKRFILSALAVSVFFVGLGALVDKTRAKFKSDEKALELVAKARQALGGDDAIKRVQALRITGTTTRKFNADGEVKTVAGDTEIAMQFPDKFMRNFNTGEAAKGDKMRVASREMRITVDGKENGDIMIHKGEGRGSGVGVGSGSAITLVLKKPDGTTEELTGADAEKWIAAHRDGAEDGRQIVLKKKIEGAEVRDLKIAGQTGEDVVVMKKKVDGEPLKTGDGNAIFMRHGGGDIATAIIHHNDFFKTALSLLMTTPEGVDVSYNYGGETNLDGTACNVVIATAAGESYRLFLDKTSNLPVGMSYTGEAVPHVVTIKTADGNGTGDVVFNRKVTAPDDGGKDVVVFTNKTPDSAGAGALHTLKRGPAPTAEYTVRFSDYRSVDGVQLPFRWTQTGGDGEEVFTVSNYEINPANISQKFEREPGVMMKMRKPGN